MKEMLEKKQKELEDSAATLEKQIGSLESQLHNLRLQHTMHQGAIQHNAKLLKELEAPVNNSEKHEKTG